MPTLYQGNSVRKPKLSVIEVLMYNMAALLAGVAAGYDVRLSNVSPVHPTLQPPSMLNNTKLNPIEMEFNTNKNDRKFTHNTYHGPARHNRALLTSMTLMPDSTPYNLPDQHQPSTISTTSGLGSNFTGLSTSLSCTTQPRTPSSRRKISTSSFTDNLEYSELDNPLNSGLATPFRTTFLPGGNVDNHPNTFEDGFSKGHRSCDYFGSNYFPYQSEVNLGFERDCKSYPDYSTYDHRYPHSSIYYEEENNETSNVNGIDIISKADNNVSTHRRTPSNLSNNSNYNQAFSVENDKLQELYAFNNLNLTSGYQKSKTFYERDQISYKDSGHLDNLACNTNTNCEYENVSFVKMHRNRSFSPNYSGNTGFKMSRTQFRGKSNSKTSSPIKDFREYSIYSPKYTFPRSPSPINFISKRHDRSPPKANKYTNNSSPPSTHHVDRDRSPLSPKFKIFSTPCSHHDMSLLLMKQERLSRQRFEHDGSNSNKIRSSLKQYSSTAIKQECAKSLSIAGTPTNPTPDSLTSDDSSYLSAKESSVSSNSRVRFSPDALKNIQSVQNDGFLLDEKLEQVNSTKDSRVTGLYESDLTS